LVITMLYEPDCVGIAAIASDMCTALAERGHDVTVYTTYPYYPEWRLKSDANPWRIKHESIAGVKVRRHGLFIPSNPSRLLPRLIHELSFPLSLTRSLLDRQAFDIVMVYCPLLGSVAFAVFRRLLHREPLWVNIQDVPADAAVASGIHRSRLFHRVASRMQKFLLNRGVVWSTISPGMLKRLETIKAANTTIHLCPNWLTDSLDVQVRQLRSKVGRPPHEPPKLLYSGTIGKKQGLSEFCRRLQSHEFEFHFLIRGEGGEAEAVRKWVHACGDPRFEFAGLLSDSGFIQSLHAADWFVIPEKQGASSSFLPSKLIPCISAGTPVLAVADSTGPLGREVIEHEIGIVVEWSQLDELPARLAHWNRDPSRVRSLQANCLKRSTDYSRSRAIDRLESLLQAYRQN
jgi:colanic acid biosynthesis glycosyl transferase WcaI